MRLRLQYILMLLLVATASSCRSDADDTQQTPLTPDYEHPISIVIDEKESRALHELNNEKLKSDCFGVYAYFTREYEYQYYSSANGFTYLKNTKFECHEPDTPGGTETWYGNPNVYYPIDHTHNLTFVAYAPYDNSYSQLKNVEFESDAIDITYAPSQNVEQQFDFCVAPPIFNQKSTSDNLPVVFDHMLTHVTFYAKVTGNTKGNDITVEQLTLKHVLGKNKLRWYPTPSTTAYEWVEPTNPEYVDYVMSSRSISTHLHNGNIANVDDYVCLQNEAGVLYLLPQKLNEATLEIEFSLHREKTAELLMSFVTKLTIPTDVVWAPAHKVRYNIDINITGITQVSIVGISDDNPGIVEWESVNPDESAGNSYFIR